MASWSYQGLHTRGTLEAYRNLASPQKWLEVHGRKKWRHYYEPHSVAKQQQFFDHFLKDKPTALDRWPKVLIEVREAANRGTWHAESAWPLPRTEYWPLFLDARDNTLRDTVPEVAASISYDPLQPDGRSVFDYLLARDMELAGPMTLHLWVEAQGSDDMDLFVAIEKLDANRRRVPFIFYAVNENGPVALGWLRVSHRALDPERSRPEQPVHTHLAEQQLSAGERVPVEIEIWPSATQFREGETLRLVVQGQDIPEAGVPNGPTARHEETRNRGRHVLHTGGAYDAFLLIPEIPPLPCGGEPSAT
jgi:putative CocE/NonD family hydrolase